jgi:protein-tyrosine-phosphatase
MTSEDLPPPPDGGAESEARRPRTEPFRILFVCTGNTCRSPLAEALARREIDERGWNGVEVRSAGVASGVGSAPSEGAVRVARRHGLSLEDHSSRPVSMETVAWADLILTMSPGHLPGVAVAGGTDRATVITAFARGEEEDRTPSDDPGVPDPFGGDEEDYEATYATLNRLVTRVLDRIAPVVSP